jgi:Dolichyl-phosphate-mannose-protein mannosyltransferase
MSSLTSREKWIVAAIASASFLLHFITNLGGAYGFFRDELYYIACSDHLAWGYVDQPPFSLYLLKASRLLLGDSLTAIRFIPAAANVGVLVLTALIIKEMGGKLFAISLACLAVFLSPIHNAMGFYYSMNSIDIFLWALAMLLLLKIINTQKNTYWIVLGVVLGVGLLNKISVLFLGSGIFVGLLLTQRKTFSTRWPYLAGILAFGLFLPYIFWNISHDMAHLEFIHNASATKYSGRGHLDFILEALLMLNPFSAPMWIIGLIALFFYPPLKQHRILGWIFLTVFVILLVNRTSKGEYLAPAFVGPYAAAGVWAEQKLVLPSVRWLRYGYTTLLVISGLLLLPLVIPVLPVETYISYSAKLGIKPSSSEKKELSELPQFYADMFGWKEKARDVAKVYATLSETDKAKCAIYSNNYGRCGALDFFGKDLGLPKSIGSHNNNWLWGPRNYTGDVMIILGGKMEDHQNDFASCERVAVSTCTYCMPYENNVGIFLCRGLKEPLKDAWKEMKHYE